MPEPKSGALPLGDSRIMVVSGLTTNLIELKINGGQRWIRTTVHSREQIYSLSPLTTRPSTLNGGNDEARTRDLIRYRHAL